MPKLPRITGKEAIAALKRIGFIHAHSRGSHFYLWREIDKRLVTVPVHSGQILKPGTLKSILEQANISVEEFIDLL